MELELSFKQRSDPQEHLLNYNVSSSTQKTEYKEHTEYKANFLPKTIRGTYKPDDLEYEIKLWQEFTSMLAIFYAYFGKKVQVLIS